jgi:sialate O-acetylesterase
MQSCGTKSNREFKVREGVNVKGGSEQLNLDKPMRQIILFSLFFYFQANAQATKGSLSLPSIFADNMILQREASIPFWGTALPGQRIVVTLNNQTQQATADNDGKWSLRLSPVSAGGPYSVTIITKDTIVLKNILIGDVWIASGQSNMEMPIAPNKYFSGIKNYEEEISNANDSLLRIFSVDKNSVVEQPQSEMTGQWLEANPTNAGKFSAVSYFFGKNIRKSLNIPIGIIHTSWGASPAQAWTSAKVLSADPDFQKLVNDWKKLDNEYQAKVLAYKKDSADAAKPFSVGDTSFLKKQVKAPEYPVLLQKRPSSLYNGMLFPLIPYAIKGVIWYQGEGNESDPKLYEKLFPAMITNWIGDWGQGDFPFLFVQLAGYKKRQTEPSEEGWARLREAQTKALKLPNTGMVTAVDIGEENDVHPKNKQEVGYRLAQCALAEVYGKNTRYSGPIFDKMRITKNKMYLSFRHADGGLMIQNSDTLKGFGICGPDKKFVWANAVIKGKQVILSNPGINNPIAVRYNWANNPVGNLYNKAGLPAMPFRTDCWEDTLVHILALGDSNGTFSYGWPQQLKKEIPNADVFNISKSGKTIGFNNNGDSTLNQLVTLDNDLLKANSYIGSEEYDYIVIGLGTNDAKYDFRDKQNQVPANLELLIKRLRSSQYKSLNKAKIVIKSPTPYGKKSECQTKYWGGNDRVKEINTKFRKIARKYHCIFVNTFTPLCNDMENLSADGLHLNEDGQKKIANLIVTGIGTVH